MNPSSVPTEFIERIHDVYHDAAERVIDSFSRPKTIAIRANTIKISPPDLVALLRERGITVIPVPAIPYAFTVPGKTARDLTDLPDYQRGLWYIQNLSSMIPAAVLDPHAGESILDMAAAPGSKTTQIAMLMQGGELIANDISRARIFKLKAILSTYGADAVTTLNKPAQMLWKQFPEHFDKVLLDAPCSMEGTFLADDPHSYAQWTRKAVKRLASQQHWMLRSAISATKPGGMIVYSTCTMSPEENEGVIDWILNKEGDAVTVESIDMPGIPAAPAVESWQGHAFRPDVFRTVRIMPDDQWEGFFIAKLRKTRATIPASMRE